MVNFTKDDLMKLTNANLSAMCKERGISIYSGKNRLNKAEMVERLLNSSEVKAEVKTEVEEKPVEEKRETVAKKKSVYIHKTGFGHPVIPNELKKQISEEIKENNQIVEPWRMGGKDKMIEEALVGTLIAFLDSKGKPRTAKMVNRSSARRQLKLITEYGREYIIPYDDVLWVKKDATIRWPRAVYLMLKEYKNGRAIPVVYSEK